MLSAVLGSVAAALAVLALDGVDAVVLVTVVLLVVVVLGVAVAGLGTGSVADPAPGRSTVGPAPKAPPTGVTNRADISDPHVHATPPSAPAASSREASTDSPRPAGPTRFDRAAKKAIRGSGRVAGNAYR